MVSGVSAGSIEFRWNIHRPIKLCADQYRAWNEPQSLEQALLVTEFCSERIDWQPLDEWVIREGIQSSKEIVEHYEKANRKCPR